MEATKTESQTVKLRIFEFKREEKEQDFTFPFYQTTSFRKSARYVRAELVYHTLAGFETTPSHVKVTMIAIGLGDGPTLSSRDLRANSMELSAFLHSELKQQGYEDCTQEVFDKAFDDIINGFKSISSDRY
jgi:hypothetical protein